MVQSSFLPKFALLFRSCRHVWTLGVDLTRSWRSRAALARCGAGPCCERDAGGGLLLPEGTAQKASHRALRRLPLHRRVG